MQEVQPPAPLNFAAAHLAALLESTRDLIWSVDLEYRLITFNQAFADHIRKDHGALCAVGVRHAQLLDPDRAKAWAEKYFSTLSHGAFRAEYQIAGGRWLEVSLYPILQDGINVGVSAFGKDITERKRTEQELTQREDLLNQTGETARIGGWELNPETGHLSWTREVFRIHEVDPDFQPTLDTAVAFYTPESRPIIDHAVRRTISHGEPFDLELTIITAKGNRKDAHAIGRIRIDADGTRIVSGTFQDITERKHLQDALRVNTRELQMLSEINGALLCATTEEELLAEYCRILVETGGYRMAWVGFAENGPDKLILPVAHHGHEDGYLKIANLTWDDTERGHGPTGRAVLTGSAQCTREISADPLLQPWHAETARRGYRSSIALPFRHSDEEMACLTAYGTSPSEWTVSEQKLMEQISQDLGFGIRSMRTEIAKNKYQQELRTSLLETIQVIAETVDQRDPYTAGHQRRVAELCARIAAKLGLSEERTLGLTLAATIHDLGKIGIPAELLSKPGRISPAELNLIKEHVRLGYEIVKNVHFPWPIANIVYQHHERINGSGYPLGLKGNDILLESRILAVADVVEAMGTDRPYRAAHGIDVALNEISSRSGILYDPDVADACVTLFRIDGYKFPV